MDQHGAPHNEQMVFTSKQRTQPSPTRTTRKKTQAHRITQTRIHPFLDHQHKTTTSSQEKEGKEASSALYASNDK
jgi:hypothetical protein